MKVKEQANNSDIRENITKTNLFHSFMGITACAVLAVVISVGSKAVTGGEKDKVFAAAEENVDLENLDMNEKDIFYYGLSGVVSGVEDTFDADKVVQRIGTSCENVMVGQRVQKIEDDIEIFDISSSMEEAVDGFTKQSMSMAASPKMMSDEDYQTLLKIVEAEAGTEDIKGRVLVANVIMNRVVHEEFPDDVTSVVWQRVNGVPQFSPTYDGRIYTVTVTEETKEAVKQALNGVDYSEGALFFIQKSAAEEHNIDWFEKDLEKLFKHGVHDFYKYPDEKTNSKSKDVKKADNATENVQVVS